jgi:hypothetical protein
VILERLRELAADEHALSALAERANREQDRAAVKLRLREDSLAQRMSDLKAKIDPLIALVERKGLGALPSIEERLEKLEAERRELDQERQVLEFHRRELEEKTLNAEVVVGAYKSLEQALSSGDNKTLEAVLPTIIDTVTWTANEDDRGGCYELALHENPLELQGLRVPGEPGEIECSPLEGGWLPLEYAVRNLLLIPTPGLVAAIESGSRLAPG